MSKKDMVFTLILFFSFAVMVYFLGASITGMTTMYCKGGECRDFCRFTTDCDPGEICCDKGGFGVCETECGNEFVFSPDVDLRKVPRLEQPVSQKPGFFSALLVLIILVGVLYYLRRRRR